MAGLRIHEARVDHPPAVPALRIHEAWVESTPEQETPTLRIHDAGVTLGQPPVGPGAVWVRVNGEWKKHIRWLRVNGKWVTGGADPVVAAGDPWPTLAQVGPKDDPSTYPALVGDFTTSHDGQVLEKHRITGRIVIQHNNVTIRDVYMNNGPTGNSQYWISIPYGANVGGITIERVEIDAPPLANGIRTIAMNLPSVTSAGVTVRNCYIHGVGSGPRLYDNTTLTDNIIQANFYAGSSSHRSGIGCNGGGNNTVRRNRIECRGNLSSAALAMYGDNAPISNWTIEDNLLIAADGFIAYGGSTAGKPYPTGTGVAYRRNRFQFVTPYSGPLYGAINDFTPGSNGCVSENNTWYADATLDNGTTVRAGDPI